MPAGEKTKLLWQDIEYRERMSEAHKGKKYSEHSKKMKGNKNAFKNRMIEILCPVCRKNKFKKFKSQKKKYCSTECRKKVLRELMTGNTRAVGFKPTKKQLANLCRKSGKDNPNWKGGCRREHKILYGSRRYKKWREKVFKRDNYTCQDCGKNGDYLEAHHIKEWANYPKLRFTLSNGKTLCKKCHNLTKKGAKTKSNGERINKI